MDDELYVDEQTDDEQMELIAGRRPPYTQVGDWVVLSGISTHARTLYWLLAMHLHMDRTERLVWPRRQDLALWMGLKNARAVDRYIKELVALNAIEVRRRRYANRLRARNAYVVHLAPPADYAGCVSVADWYAANKAPERPDVSAAQPVVRCSAPRGVPETPPEDVSAGRPVVRSRALRSAPQRTSVVRHSPLNKKKNFKKKNTTTNALADDAAAPTDPSPAVVVEATPEKPTQAAKLLTELSGPWALGKPARARLEPAVAAALAAGWGPTNLIEKLTADPPERIRTAEKLLARRLVELPDPPRPPRQTRSQQAPRPLDLIAAKDEQALTDQAARAAAYAAASARIAQSRARARQGTRS